MLLDNFFDNFENERARGRVMNDHPQDHTCGPGLPQCSVDTFARAVP